MKKISVVGRGTVGCLTVSHYLKWTDYVIDWIFDPLVPTTPVGEGTNLVFPSLIETTMDFDSADLDATHSTPKMGIWKRGWGNGKDFKHTFPAGRVGIHFNALEFQNYVFDRYINHPRINIIEDSVLDCNSLDSDFVMLCTGSPKKLNDDFVEHSSIPVNSAIVFQCPWEFPKFLYSLTFAKKYGWVFGIPLKNRCAIGYVYNEKFSSDDQVREDVQSIFKEFDLKPNTERKLNFYNYSRKNNFTDRLCYNGNASFFLEPLEATSTGNAIFVNRLSFDIWVDKKITTEEADKRYATVIDEIESMICLHYLSGSVYKTDFWSYAKSLAEEKYKKVLNTESEFKQVISETVFQNYTKWYSSVGTWSSKSFFVNITNLGLTEKLKSMFIQTVD